ncbi:MAG: hypothetical protein ACXV5Q_00685 [Frankiaceae bacterium]
MPSHELFGETFQLANEIGEFALMEFAEAAEDVESNSLGAMAAVMRLLREAVLPEDWPRFRAVCRANKASAESLLPIVYAVFQQETDRPTQRPSDSSDGPVTIAPRSAVDSSSRVIQQLEDEGRPAWALIAKQVQESRAG